MKNNLIKTKDVVKKILLVFLIMLTAFMAVSMPTSFISYADDNSGNSLDTTDPLTDLRSDSEFNILDYPFNKNGALELKFFNEYCYSFYTEMQDNFALYVYMYNPQALEILDSPLNKIQMAVGYDAKGNPNDYEKFELKLCSFSSEYDYYRLFYKFKVVDHLTNGLSIYDRLNSNERRYDVSGVELVTPNALNATDKGVSKTYYYTGYAKGYGPNFEAPESTLKQRVEKLDTVELNVQHTFWRSETSNTGANYQNQLDTVYFTVPNKFLEDYGKLQRIKAEWYEYKTKDIIVTSNKDFYNAVWPYVGTPVGRTHYVPDGMEPFKMDQDDSIGFGLLENDRKENPTDAMVIIGPGLPYIADWIWNDDNPDFSYEVQDTLYYLLPTADWKPIGEYDPYGDMNNVGDGTKDALLNYILRYDKSYTNGKLPIKNGTISADLFESDIDDYRKIDNENGKIQQGYSYYDFDASVDILEWKSYKPGEQSYRENVKMFGFWNYLFGKTYVNNEDFSNVSPILLLEDESTVSGLPIDISKRLHVNINDADKIRDLYYEAQEKDETVVLFRFALTDYYSAPLIIDHFDSAYIKDQAYRAVQSVFFDFDIIQLTFQKEEVLNIVPVISNPIDIVNNPTPPTDLKDRSILEIILAWTITIVSIILGVVLGCYVYKLIVQIYSGNAHIVVKILMTIPIAAVVIAICFWVIPWVVRLVLSLGGL